MKKSILILFYLLFLFVTPLQATELENILIKLQDIIANAKAEVGVAVRMDGKELIAINAHFKYPLQSVFKLHQVLAVCNELEKRKMPLDRTIKLQKSDLAPNTWSPLRNKYPEGKDRISLRELIEYALIYSDNNASDILFSKIIDTAGTDQFIRTLGINDFAIIWTENDMHNNINYCYDNWTSPMAAAKLLEIFLNGDAISSDHQEFIKNTLIKCETGENRIPAGVSDGNVVIGHKTGTGDINKNGEIIAINDVGFVMLPNGKNYIISIFIKNSLETLEQTEGIIAAISKTVYDFMTLK